MVPFADVRHDDRVSTALCFSLFRTQRSAGVPGRCLWKEEAITPTDYPPLTVFSLQNDTL